MPGIAAYPDGTFRVEYLAMPNGRVLGANGVPIPTPRNAAGIIRVMVNGTLVRKRIARLVCEEFHGPAPYPYCRVVFKDGNKRNRTASNVTWNQGEA